MNRLIASANYHQDFFGIIPLPFPSHVLFPPLMFMAVGDVCLYVFSLTHSLLRRMDEWVEHGMLETST